MTTETKTPDTKPEQMARQIVALLENHINRFGEFECYVNDIAKMIDTALRGPCPSSAIAVVTKYRDECVAEAKAKGRAFSDKANVANEILSRLEGLGSGTKPAFDPIAVDRIRRQQVKRRQDMAQFGKDYIVGTVTLDNIDFLLSLLPNEEAKSQHPEDFCERCARPNVVWFAPSDLWNQVVRANNEPEILCPVCFVQLAEKYGVKHVWRVGPQVSEWAVLREARSEPHKFLRQPLGMFPRPENDNGKCWQVVNKLYCGLAASAPVHQIHEREAVLTEAREAHNAVAAIDSLATPVGGPQCAGLAGCQVLEAALSEMFVHDENCPKGPQRATSGGE